MTSSKSTDTAKAAETPLSRDLLYAAWFYLGGRRGLWAVAAVALVAGLALNWSWLVAAGAAPILLAALPCAAMCALGLCMNKMARRSDASDATAQRTIDEAAGDRTASIDVAESRGDTSDPRDEPSSCCDDRGHRPEAPETTREKENTHA